jgi:hypothetical protein
LETATSITQHHFFHYNTIFTKHLTSSHQTNTLRALIQTIKIFVYTKSSIYTFPHLPSFHVSHTHLAAKHCGSRRIIRLRSSIQVVNNPRIILLVRAGEADRRRRLVCRSAYDVDLCAFLISHISSGPFLQEKGWRQTYHVELRAHALTRRMQCDEFTAQKVLAGCNALGDSDCLHAFVCDQAVDAPF